MNTSSNVGKPKGLKLIELKGSNTWTSRQQSTELVKVLTDMSRFNQLQITKQSGKTPVDQMAKDYLNAWRIYFEVQPHDVFCLFYRKQSPVPSLINGQFFQTVTLKIATKNLIAYPVFGDIIHLLTEQFQTELNEYLMGKDQITISKKSLRQSDCIVICAVFRYFSEAKMSLDSSQIDQILFQISNIELEAIQKMAQDDLDRILKIIKGSHSDQNIEGYVGEDQNIIEQ